MHVKPTNSEDNLLISDSNQHDSCFYQLTPSGILAYPLVLIRLTNALVPTIYSSSFY